MDASSPQLIVEWRGRERYVSTWARQLELHEQRRQGACLDTLLLVEHEPVITLGRQGELKHLMVTEEMLAARGVDFHRVERGGDITYHGPGQLVGYPIISLSARGLSVREFMRGLEEALIRTLGDFGIETGRVPRLTGVWRGEQKLAALGVAVRGGVSFHGFALNVCTDLSYFQMIVPCGIVGREVASMASVLGRDVTLDEVRPRCEACFREVFGYSR